MESRLTNKLMPRKKNLYQHLFRLQFTTLQVDVHTHGHANNGPFNGDVASGADKSLHPEGLNIFAKCRGDFFAFGFVSVCGW